MEICLAEYVSNLRQIVCCARDHETVIEQIMELMADLYRHSVAEF
jgi:hypothetical protein